MGKPGMANEKRMEWEVKWPQQVSQSLYHIHEFLLVCVMLCTNQSGSKVFVVFGTCAVGLVLFGPMSSMCSRTDSPGACAVGDGAGGKLKGAEPAAHRHLAEGAALSPLSGRRGPWLDLGMYFHFPQTMHITAISCTKHLGRVGSDAVLGTLSSTNRCRNLNCSRLLFMDLNVSLLFNSSSMLCFFFSSLNERLRCALNKIEIKDFVQFDCSMSSCDSSLTVTGEVPLILYVWLLASEVRFNLADQFTHEFDNLIETCTFFRFPQIQVFYKMYPGESIFFWLCNSKSFWRERACENWQVLLWTW